MGACSGGPTHRRPSTRPEAISACQRKRWATGEHGPDRLSQLAGDLDRGHLGVALATEVFLGGLVVAGISQMADSMHSDSIKVRLVVRRGLCHGAARVMDRLVHMTCYLLERVS
jgi:hypothetical protein